MNDFELKSTQLFYCQGIYWWIGSIKLYNHPIFLFLWLFAPEPVWENQHRRQQFFFPLSFYKARNISFYSSKLYFLFNHSREFLNHGKLLNQLSTLLGNYIHMKYNSNSFLVRLICQWTPVLRWTIFMKTFLMSK